MTGRVSGKVVVVTGAASGLGEATARVMHAEGATVLLTDIQDTGGSGSPTSSATGPATCTVT